MPKTWYVKAANRIKDGDSLEVIEKKNFYNSICSNKKPYFFMYNYSSLKTEYDKYVKSAENICYVSFGVTLQDLLNSVELDEEESVFVENYYKYMPLDASPGTINRICWRIEDEFSGKKLPSFKTFDYECLKSGAQYTQQEYDEVFGIYGEYLAIMKEISKNVATGEKKTVEVELAKRYFVEKCDELCIDKYKLCDIVIDICYTTNKSKQFAWDICGDTIVNNLLKKHDFKLSFPKADKNGDIIFNGEKFSMTEIKIGGEQ